MKLLALVALAAAVVAVAIIATGGSGDSAEGAGEPVYGVGENRVGSVAGLAQCSDWQEGTEEEKRATVTDLYNQLNQAGADGPTPDMPPDEAYRTLERACSQDYATGFRLYKIYARSSAFGSLLE